MLHTLTRTLTTTSRANMASITSVTEMSASEAKWITLQRINWKDQDGKDRIWECAARKTRGKAECDAVAVLAMLRSKTDKFPLSTVIIEQYRPPVDAIVIGILPVFTSTISYPTFPEMPAGLIDQGETAEQAAVRELTEETGYVADHVVESSPVTVSDPGMTNANMKLVVVDVSFEGELIQPEQKLEDGEHIVVRVVELAKLSAELKAYSDKGFVVDSKLSHFASGWDMAQHYTK